MKAGKTKEAELLSPSRLIGEQGRQGGAKEPVPMCFNCLNKLAASLLDDLADLQEVGAKTPVVLIAPSLAGPDFRSIKAPLSYRGSKLL